MLLSIDLPHVPQLIEVLPMVHTERMIAVLCAVSHHIPAAHSAAVQAAAAACGTMLLLVSTTGNILRSVADVNSWHASDFLRWGHPQLLLRRPHFHGGCGTAASTATDPSGYALMGLNATWADVPADGRVAEVARATSVARDNWWTAAEGTAGWRPKEEEARARWWQLHGVALALSERVAEGYEAIKKAWLAVEERGMLCAHAHSMLLAEAADISQQTDGGVRYHRGAASDGRGDAHAPMAEAGATRHLLPVMDKSAVVVSVDSGLLDRWYEAAQLAHLPCSSGALGRAGTVGRTRPVLAVAPATAPSNPIPAATAPPYAGQPLPRLYASAALPLAVSVEQAVKQGYWLLRLWVRNDGDGGCMQVGCTPIHPTLELLVESTTLAKLDPGELGALTMAVPTASLVFAEAVEIDLMLTWRTQVTLATGKEHRADVVQVMAARAAEGWTAQAMPAGGVVAAEGAVAAAAMSDGRCGGARREQGSYHRIVARVRLRGWGLFDASLLATKASLLSFPSPPRPVPELLPAALQHSVYLVVEAPLGSHTLHDLPRLLATLLCLAPLEPYSTAPLHVMAGATLCLPPLLGLPKLVCRSHGATAMGGGRGASTCFKAALAFAGRCAEVRITSCGSVHEVMLAGALRALQAGLPSAARIEVSFASDGTLMCLRHGSLALQAEFHGSGRACKAFLGSLEEASNGRLAARVRESADALLREIATLQSSTDSQMSQLHELLG